MFIRVQLLLFFCVIATIVNAEGPDCGIRNQFRGYCFSFTSCNDFECTTHKCGYFLRYSVKLKILQTRIIPQCAITNSTSLKYISGFNSNIQVLTSGSFANLPNLESILLPYNQIRELHHGIFYNVHLPLLDLSWNKIIYISEGAFNGITGLKYLNLSKNELATLPVENLPKTLVKINLAYNFLERIALNGAKRPDLTSVDLSYNNLKHVALSFDNTLEELDLTDNNLKDIDFYDINDCENLKIPENLFTEVPQFLEYSRIRRVALHPNPWKCDELQRLWTHLQNNNIEEVKSKETESQPLCSINRQSAGLKLKNLACETDNHCAKTELCRAHRCWNPCSTACHSTNICNVKNHEIECSCPKVQKKNPQEFISPCYDVECFSKEDCLPEYYCNYNKSCVDIGSSLNFPSHGQSYPVPSSVNTGYGSPAYYPEPPKNQGNLPDGSPSSYPSQPWWFEEIPKLAPSSNTKLSS